MSMASSTAVNSGNQIIGDDQGQQLWILGGAALLILLLVILFSNK